MIQITKEEHDDARFLQVRIDENLGPHTFTIEQEQAIKKLLLDVANGYLRTISRQSWGPGWD